MRRCTSTRYSSVPPPALDDPRYDRTELGLRQPAALRKSVKIAIALTPLPRTAKLARGNPIAARPKPRQADRWSRRAHRSASRLPWWISGPSGYPRPVIGERVQSDPKSGRIFSIDAFPVPDLDGTGPLVIESAHDITEQRRLEAHVRYQEKLAALGVLSAGIAHDIANPLASMSSELEMLEDETDPARLRASFGVLRGQVSRIDRSLREMTDFARRRGDEATSVPVAEAVDDALRMVRHDPRARKVSFEVDIAPELPKLRMVEDHLVMVLVNLIINAFDAMPDGGTLAVRARRDAGGLTLTVSGMTDEVKKRATEPLFTTKGGGRGTGLGLSVSSEILASAKGTLGIDSTRGHGTTVRLHFGAAAVEPPPEQVEVAHA